MKTILANRMKEGVNDWLSTGKRLIPILFLLLFGVGNAWAEPYIEVFGLQFYESSTNRYFKTGSEIKNDLAFGNKTSDFKLVYIYANAKKNGGNLCGAMYFKWWLEGTDGASNSGGVGYTSNSWSGDYCYEKFGTENGSSSLNGLDFVQNRRPGNYTFKFYFSFEGNNSSSGCGTWYDCKYSGGDFKFTYTIPDPTITITGASSLVAGTSTNISASISNYPVGSKITKVRVTGNIASAKETTGSATSMTVSSVTPNASGSNGITVTVTVKFGTGGTKDYTSQYNVTPPAVSDFTISATSGSLGGSGTSENPWLVTYNGSLTLGLSGATKAYADGNASPQYSTDGTNYGTTGSYISKTHSSITATTNQNWKYKARLKNNSSALYGSVKEKTVYWKVSTSSVTLNKNGGSSNGSATATHGRNTLASISAPSKTGYNVEGYYTNEACTTKVATSAGALQASTTYTTSGSLWNVLGAQTLYTKWSPKQYTLTLNKNSGSANGSIKVTYDSNGTSNFTPVTRTGYNCTGYWTSTSGGNKIINRDGTLVAFSASVSTYINSSGNWIYDGNPSLNAQWTPKQCTINFDFDESDDGYGSKTGATTSVTATYDAAMTSVTPPTAKEGYAFMGYWDAADGAGTQYYKADGTSKRTWNKDTESPTTLYAYYTKGTISALTLDAAIVAQGNTVGITPTLDPVPVGDKVICWRVLHGNGNPLDDQPTFTWDGTKVTFPASTNSGTYLAEAILRKGTTCGGEVLDSVTVSFQVAGDHVVTVQYKCGDEFIQTSTTATGRPLSWTEITAPDIFGYTFSKWKAGDGITIQGADGSGEKASATINFKATYEGKLTAIYTQKQLIYFKNTLGWSDVYVNFYTEEYWNNPKGSGNQSVTNRNKHMTHIEETDIWYYDYGAASISPSLYVSFTSKSQDNSQYFWGKNPDVNVVYPAHYQDAIHTDKSSENGFKAATPMFVPIAGQSATPLNSYDSGKANYYNRGYWTKYTPGTGYTLEIYNSAGNTLLKSVEFTSDNDLMPMTAVVDLEAGQTYKYQLRRGGTESAGIYYGNSNTMSYSNCTGWEMINTMSPSFSKAGITVNAAGDYVFTLNYAANNSSQYRLRMTVKYPVSMGDFRIVYSDNDTWSRGVAHTLGTWIMKSHTITARANGIDTVSFFISRGHSPEIRWEKATSQSGTAITWGTRGSWLTTGYTDVSESAVYNFKVTQNANGTAISSIERIGKYTGDYYIRTDAANSKWDNYTVDPDHRMTYSEYSIDHGGYSHYYCHWVQTDDRKNVKFCIANDYSPSISDTLTREVASGEWANIGSFIDAGGNILRNANVRFMWNQSTNKISRAYIDGAQGPGSNNFLKMLSSDSKIKDLSGTIKTEVYFQDNENWIYETNIQAQANAKYKLVSNWGTSPVITQYFKGTISSTETLITGSGSDFHVIRVIYDFKTNRIIAAWMPSGEYDDPRAINADVMFIREHQGDINQIMLTDAGTITDIKTAYGVMRFNKWTINNKDKSTHLPLDAPASIYERSLYWVSFPFRVKLSEVFGFGTYGTHWILQYYDGAARAQYGMWAETGTYWKFIWDRKDFILEPNVGYLLTLETELMGEGSDIWGPNSRSSQVELYFPSYGDMPDITQADVVTHLEEHTCTIDRTGEGLPGGNDYRTTYDRRIVDSHWNVLSVPTYVNTDDVTFPTNTWTTTTRPKFLYTWNPDDNTITAASASKFTFHAMHAYMVQCYGNVTWSAKSGSPYPIVARSTYSAAPKEVEFCLELQQNEKMVDRTYISLSDDEDVSEGFAFNEDMTKEFSGNKPAIYTFIAGDVVAAGNTLPMTEMTTIVPVGVETKAAGDYTIAIPAGTSGIGVTLIDEQTGVRTNLSALDYTINLPAGKHDNRFFLEISPIKTTPTGLEPTSDSSLKGREVRKVLIDQQMYIIKDGKMYDARGNLCK